MLNGVSLDHLRTFVAAADLGSFSAAGRKLGRAQSVVSHTLASLENQLSLSLFDRSGRYPALTPAGRSLLPAARQIVRDADSLKAQAHRLSAGLEPLLSVVIDVMFPQKLLTEVITEFAAAFPGTPIRLHVEALGAVAQLVVSGQCSIGVMGTFPLIPKDLTSERLLSVEMVTVVSPAHALSRVHGPITLQDADAHTQLVLTDRSELTKGVDLGVQSKDTWRLSDLGAKHAFLLAGLGWGHMPMPMVRDDLKAKRLVQISLEGPGAGVLPMQAIYKPDFSPGPAARWLLDRIRDSDVAAR